MLNLYGILNGAQSGGLRDLRQDRFVMPDLTRHPVFQIILDSRLYGSDEMGDGVIIYIYVTKHIPTAALPWKGRVICTFLWGHQQW